MRDKTTKKSLKSALLFGEGGKKVSNDFLRADSVSYSARDAEMRCEKGREFQTL